MKFKAGDVIRIFDRFTKPQKPKWHIVICPFQRRHLRINSNRSPFGGEFRLERSSSPFLQKDESFVELTHLVRHYHDEVRDAELLGCLAIDIIVELCDAIRTAKRLPEDDKRLIVERLEQARLDLLKS